MRKIGKEFKEFISRGNVLNLAVGVIIGTAFTAIVNSLVKDVFMPLIGLITGGINLAALSIPLGKGENAAALGYGAFFSAVLNFLVVAVIVFFFMKAVNRLQSIGKKEEQTALVEKRHCPYCMSDIPENAIRCPYCTSMLDKSPLQ